MIGFGLFLVLWTAMNADRVAAVESALIDLAGSVPLWFDQMYSIAFFLGLLLIIFLVGAALAQGTKRLDLLRDMTLAIVVSVVAAVLVVWMVDGVFPTVLPEFTTRYVVHAFPILRVAVLTAIVLSSIHRSPQSSISSGTPGARTTPSRSMVNLLLR